MTNLEYILKMLKKEGKENSHKNMINVLINCLENYDEVEYWVMNYVWLFDEVPKIVKKYIEGGNNVQFPENPDLDIRGHDAIMPES